MNRRGGIRRLILLGALMAAVVYFAVHRDFLDPSGLERELQRFGRQNVVEPYIPSA